MVSIRNMQLKDKTIIQDMIENMIGGPNVAETAKSEVEKYSNQQDFQVFVAEIALEIVGFGVIRKNPFEGGDGIAELGLFQIRRECRNQGIGTQLFNAIEENLRSASVRKLYTKTNTKNLQAAYYWLKHGFEFEARLNNMNAKTDYYLLSKDLIK
jgi:GNAT superfamily N-acetyltransferase